MKTGGWSVTAGLAGWVTGVDLPGGGAVIDLEDFCFVVPGRSVLRLAIGAPLWALRAVYRKGKYLPFFTRTYGTSPVAMANAVGSRFWAVPAGGRAL